MSQTCASRATPTRRGFDSNNWGVQRIWVIGASGTGKTTLAAEVARRLDVSHVELDAIHHGPDWAEPDPDEFRAAVAAEVAKPAWVIDGAYRAKLGDLVPGAADTIV